MGSVARSKYVPEHKRANFDPRKSVQTIYIPAKMRRAVMKRDDHRCQICFTEEDLRIVHRVPISRGGETLAFNLVVFCRRCAYAKGSQTPEEFMLSPYFMFDILGQDDKNRGKPWLVKVVLDNGEVLQGVVFEDPSTIRQDFTIQSLTNEAKVSVPWKRVVYIGSIPKLLHKPISIPTYLESVFKKGD